MPRTFNIILHETSSYGLRPQSKLGQYDFPFTLNSTVGCFFGCTYCYAPFIVYGLKPNRKELFFNNVHVKLDKPAHLEKELERFKTLPQHMKRVQINETSEYYLPQLLTKLDSDGIDLMGDILKVFKRHWEEGNCWMLHILTKSRLILKHLELLKEMKHMVQIEMSFASSDEEITRSLEYFTPSVKRRLEAMEILASNGIFVRVMAMPFCGDELALIELQEITFGSGASAFKNKNLNYYVNWDDLAKERSWEKYLTEKIATGKGREDLHFDELIIKSGEYVNVDNEHVTKTVMMPIMDGNCEALYNWSAISFFDERFANRQMNMIDCGYGDCNNLDWNYII
ncbi:MAG: radical SAM protein [Melioribacteraceae bacterium]|nr:radical SAM protein [Melioribacteraceae bacterium]